MGSWPNQCTNANQGGYPWWVQDNEQYNCMRFGAPNAGSVLPGCKVSCQPCRQDDFQSLIDHLGVPVKNWDTWIRPSKEAESRIATGRYFWPISGVPFLINDAGGAYELSVCTDVGAPGTVDRFKNLWGKSICDCKQTGAPGVCSSDFGCTEYAGKFSPCFIHRAADWPPGSTNNDIQCLGKFLGGGPLQLRLDPSRLGNLATVRVNAGNAGAVLNPDFYAVNQQEFGCTPHWNPLCWGLQAEGSADCAVPNEVNRFHPAWQAWNFLRVLVLGSKWWDEPGGAGLEPAAVKAKNRVLAWINQRKGDMPAMPNGTLQNLDQVDRDFTTTDYWRRAWNQHPQLINELAGNLPLVDIPMDGAQRDNIWENCYLERSGHRVRVEYKPYDIFLGVSLQFLHEDKRPLCGQPLTTAELRRFLYKASPQIRIELKVRMAILAEFADDDPPIKQLTNPHQPVSGGLNSVVLGINNPETVANQSRRVPVIVAGDTGEKHVDRIVYVDKDGRRFKRQPPLEFTWIGEQNAFRDHVEDIYPQGFWDGPPNSVPLHCCGLIEVMKDGHTVRASYTDRHAVYTDFVPQGSSQDALTELKRTRGMRGSMRIAVGLPIQAGC